MLSDGVTYSDVQRSADIDVDYILDHIEINDLHTDPTKADSMGLGIPDFHRFYIYPQIGNNVEAAKEFLAKIPNVEAMHWYADDGGYWKSDAQVVKISVQDPQIESLDKQIIWKNGEKGSVGDIMVDGKPIFSEYGGIDNGDKGPTMPSEFFTHGRIGICRESALAHWTILECMGYKAMDVGVTFNGIDHELTEVEIDGKIYVADFGKLYPREVYYGRHPDMKIYTQNYNRDWYKN
jgi:hypothetical protein